MLVEINQVRLYQPEAILGSRFDDMKLLANYMKAIVREVGATLEEPDVLEAKGLLIAVGVKPGGRSRAWCDPVGGQISSAALAELERRVADLPAVGVNEGPIAFAVELLLSGQKVEEFPIGPKAWSEAASTANEPLLVPDGIFARIWPD